jgi:putative (di)nucleoside polyphosphate hydrolase
VSDDSKYRPNVGIVLVNASKQVFWGRRSDLGAWQFPQGGVGKDESIEDAMLRELYEEIGLLPQHVKILGITQDWLSYLLPEPMFKEGEWFIGQKQRWFLLELCGKDSDIKLDMHEPEFDDWKWVDYWYPVEHISPVKRPIYQKILTELEEYLG